MKSRVVVLGAGFGGLELVSTLSEACPDSVDLTLIDKNDSFIFGFSKLDVMFGRRTPEEVRLPYRRMAKRGVRFRQELITAIDPARKRVTTEGATYEADVLVVALGADYDLEATPGLSEGGHEFYTLAGAERVSKVLPTFSTGQAIVGVTSTPFKCPPAPSEATLLLHDYLTERGTRQQCEISLVMPSRFPLPPVASRALLAAFAERGITFVGGRCVRALDPGRRVAVLDDGSELPCTLFLGIPKHCAPEVVQASGMTENGWIPVNPRNLETRFPGVFAVGDVTNLETPMAGAFAEGAAQVVAQSLIAELNGGERPPPYAGVGTCYIEFGGGRVGRAMMDFLSESRPTGTFTEPSVAITREKEQFGSSRRSRWFGA